MAARLAWQNLLTASGVVISSSSEATGYVDDNLASPMRWKKWQSTSTTGDQWVKFDLGSSKSLQVFAAINAVLHTGGTLRVQANAADSWGSPTVDTVFTVPATDYTGVLIDWRGAPTSLRWVRFYFTNVGAVNMAVSVGAVFAGNYLEPSSSLSTALNIQRIDPSVQRYAIGGQRSAVLRSKFHHVSGTFVLQAASARQDLRRLYETLGATVPAILAVDPNDPSLIFYGTLQSTLEAQHHGPDLWDMPIEFTEDVA